jgi:hypothetical protein
MFFCMNVNSSLPACRHVQAGPRVPAWSTSFGRSVRTTAAGRFATSSSGVGTVATIADIFVPRAEEGPNAHDLALLPQDGANRHMWAIG